MTTAVPISEELKEGIVRFIKSTTDIQNLELETIVDKEAQEAYIRGLVNEIKLN